MIELIRINELILFSFRYFEILLNFFLKSFYLFLKITIHCLTYGLYYIKDTTVFFWKIVLSFIRFSELVLMEENNLEKDKDLKVPVEYQRI